MKKIFLISYFVIGTLLSAFSFDIQKIEDYYYEVINDEVRILVYRGEESIVHIPESIDDKPVTVIGGLAFEKNDRVVEIVIPKTVTIIESRAFSQMPSLQLVTIPDSVTKMVNPFYESDNVEISTPEGSYAYRYAIEQGIQLYENMEVIVERGATSEYEYFLVLGEVTLEKYIGSNANVIIPTEINGYPVTSLGDTLFKDNAFITSVSIPETVTSVGSDVFSGCRMLQMVSIPLSLTEIHDNIFIRCISLKEIIIPKNHTTLTFKNFALINKKTNTLVSHIPYSGQTEYIVPKGILTIGKRAFAIDNKLISVQLSPSVERIEEEAFSILIELQEVKLSKNLNYIGDKAFFSCMSLEKLIIPKSVTSIGEQAFFAAALSLYVEENTVAHEYALENNLLFVVE